MHTDGKTDGRTEIRKEGQKYNSLYLILIRSKNIILRITDCYMFLGEVSLGRVEVSYPETVIYLPWTYEKLHCKRELLITLQLLARSFGTDEQTAILLLFLLRHACVSYNLRNQRPTFIFSSVNVS